MPGVGTLCNMAGIVAGGAAGLAFSRFFTDSLRKLMLSVCGLAFFLIGISGVMQEMLVIEDGALTGRGSMTLIVSLALGALIGESLHLHEKIERFGDWLGAKANGKNTAGETSGADDDDNEDLSFAGAFIKASLVVCIGAMAILGPITECFYHDHTILIAKTLIDFVTIMILSISCGKGCLFAAIPVGICQGILTAAAVFIEPYMTAEALSDLTMVGSAVILMTGINLLWEKNIKVANLAPAIFVAVALAFLPAI